MRAKFTSSQDLQDALGLDFLAFFIGLAEAAAERARSFFKEGEAYNRTVGATLMRYTLRDGLMQASGSMFSPEAHGFNVQSARNLAIWFEFEGFMVRGYTVPKGKLPIKGETSPQHRNDHFGNVPPDQQTLFSKCWAANVSLLWSFDKQGHFIGLRAVVGDGWDDEGQLKLALDLELPTTAAELRAQMSDANFAVEEDDEKLIAVERTTEVKSHEKASVKE